MRAVKKASDCALAVRKAACIISGVLCNIWRLLVERLLAGSHEQGSHGRAGSSCSQGPRESWAQRHLLVTSATSLQHPLRVHGRRFQDSCIPVNLSCP
jgi:hypothetical protein